MVISPSSPLLPFSPLFSSSLSYILQAFDYLDDYTPSEYFAVMSSSRNSYGYIYTSDFSVSIFFSLSLFQFFFLYLFVFKSLLILLQGASYILSLEFIAANENYQYDFARLYGLPVS